MIPTPNNILEIARVDPVVSHCVELWKHGKVTWEQAMMIAVLEMAQKHKFLEEQLVTEYEKEL